MTTTEPGVSRLDSAPLANALDRINRARRDVGSGRFRALLTGFETLLEADPSRRAPRELDGADAFDELEALLAEAGDRHGTDALRMLLEPALDRLVEGLAGVPERRLAVYGSLAPGEANHHLVSALVGTWIDGVVCGTLHDRGWAAGTGFPGLTWDPSGADVRVRVLESGALPAAWERLDAFEGADYRRILVPVRTETRVVVCNIYELAEPTPRA
ncbi:MAG: gamma-glutamylcyclotransferase [Gemmatimonadetes bacterium]|nr:gamma-glutamylcyclotransferase [Gemmatimonadota bacterium]